MFLLNSTSSFWLQLWQLLNNWDQWLFLKINNSWTNPFLDNIFPWWRDGNTWIPLYFFLLLFAVMNFGWRIWPWILFFILTVSLTDQLSSSLIKNWFHRPRPCSDETFMNQVRLLLNHCSGGYSFTSSHAANHFGLACYIYSTMRLYFKKWGYLFFFWAATISYGQVYVGVHYPLDIAGGAIAGSFIGMMTGSIFNRRIGLPSLLFNKKTNTG